MIMTLSHLIPMILTVTVTEICLFSFAQEAMSAVRFLPIMERRFFLAPLRQVPCTSTLPKMFVVFPAGVGFKSLLNVWAVASADLLNASHSFSYLLQPSLFAACLTLRVRSSLLLLLGTAPLSLLSQL